MLCLLCLLTDWNVKGGANGSGDFKIAIKKSHIGFM